MNRTRETPAQRHMREMRSPVASHAFAPKPGARSVTRSPDGGLVNTPKGGSVGAPNSVGAGFGDDCSSDSDCGPGLTCAFGTCIGVPLPTVPPALCGANSHPSSSTLGCECDAGYIDTGNGCVLPLIPSGAAPEAACALQGGTWDAGNATCACPSGQTWDGVSLCTGTPDTIEAACNAGGGTWDGNSCQCAIAGQIFSNGQCGPGCFDSFGNPGDLDANGVCVGNQCAPGQGRGDQTQQCMDCGINGFQADGIHCNECPPGSTISADGSACVCNGGKNWNADGTACVTGGTGAPPVTPPISKQPPTTTCAPGMTPVSSAPGAPCATPPPALAKSSGSGNGLLYGIGAAALLAAVVIATSKKGGKKSSKRSSHRR